MSETLFALHQVRFSYPGGSPVLNNADFTFSRTDRIGLYGHNGSGKTTFLHLVMGLLHPASGYISFRGSPVKNEEDFRILRRHIGLVLQNAEDQLFCPTVLEDVAFGPLNLGLNQKQAQQRALTTLHSLGLHGFEHRLTHQLSGGEKKLVSLATVLAMHPCALLLDEPTNNLDPATRERLADILADLPTGLIIISHDEDFLSRITNSRLTIMDGQLVPTHKETTYLKEL